MRLKHRVSQYGLSLLLLLIGPIAESQTNESAPAPVVLSARLNKTTVTYWLNGKRVEDSRRNSLLTNLGSLLKTRGSQVTVFIVVDVRAPFSEIGKLETALDKIGLPNYRLFVTNFSDETMNEIHLDEKAVPIPRTSCLQVHGTERE